MNLADSEQPGVLRLLGFHYGTGLDGRVVASLPLRQVGWIRGEATHGRLVYLRTLIKGSRIDL
jgi:hypothetical protein